MKKQIFKENEINELTSLIHDQEFDVAKINFNTQDKLLEIGFRNRWWDKTKIVNNFILFKKKAIPISNAVLRIYNVRKYEVKDDERIGTYEFNIISYAHDSDKITITAEPNLSINIFVDSFLIELEVGEDIIDDEIHYSFFSIET